MTTISQSIWLQSEEKFSLHTANLTKNRFFQIKVHHFTKYFPLVVSEKQLFHESSRKAIKDADCDVARRFIYDVKSTEFASWLPNVPSLSVLPWKKSKLVFNKAKTVPRFLFKIPWEPQVAIRSTWLRHSFDFVPKIKLATKSHPLCGSLEMLFLVTPQKPHSHQQHSQI